MTKYHVRDITVERIYHATLDVMAIISLDKRDKRVDRAKIAA